MKLTRVDKKDGYSIMKYTKIMILTFMEDEYLLLKKNNYLDKGGKNVLFSN